MPSESRNASQSPSSCRKFLHSASTAREGSACVPGLRPSIRTHCQSACSTRRLPFIETSGCSVQNCFKAATGISAREVASDQSSLIPDGDSSTQ